MRATLILGLLVLLNTQERFDTAIRTEYVPRHPEHGTRAIARRLGVSQWTISHALRGETWRHV